MNSKNDNTIEYKDTYLEESLRFSHAKHLIYLQCRLKYYTLTVENEIFFIRKLHFCVCEELKRHQSHMRWIVFRSVHGH